MCGMTNNTGGIRPPKSHAEMALSHVQAAKAARLHLEDLYGTARPAREEIAALHQEIGFALKLAEIHALLALVPTPPAAEYLAEDLDRDLRRERFSTSSRLS